MKILIIGGTKFLGRHLMAAALAGGHEVTLFNRGRHSAEKFENVEQIHGDRNSDLDRLGKRRWDAVIDTCGYLPESVRLAAGALREAVEQYVFVSSISAYADFSRPDFNETAPAAQMSPEQQERAAALELTGEISAAVLAELYGPLKAQCEQAVAAELGGRVLNVRPGLIVGPFDPTDRFTYWVMRVADGGEVLAPGCPDRFVQLIDARDLAQWIIKMVENRQTGLYNVTGRPFELTMAKMLAEIKTVSGSDAEFVWVSEEFLTGEEVAPWSEMPLYLPESSSEWRGFLSANINRALEAGLEFRPLSDTIRETLDWRRAQDREPAAGISPARERELLGKWHELSGLN